MSMLRRQDYAVELGQIEYVAPPPQKCQDRLQKIEEYRKLACSTGKLKAYGADEYGHTLQQMSSAIDDTHRVLQNQFKAQACNPLPPCFPMTTCKAKTSTFHDGTDNVSSQLIGLGVKGDGNMGHLYNSYRDVKIVDTDELVRQIRAGNEPVQSQVTKMAEYNAGMFGGAYHAVDGVGTGYSCYPCPPKKKPCPVEKCKKPDPLNNPETGIGSDALESKSNLFDIFQASRVQPQLASFLGVGNPLPQRTEATQTEKQGEQLSAGEVRDLIHEGVAVPRGVRGRSLSVGDSDSTASRTPVSSAPKTPPSQPGARTPPTESSMMYLPDQATQTADFSQQVNSGVQGKGAVGNTRPGRPSGEVVGRVLYPRANYRERGNL